MKKNITKVALLFSLTIGMVGAEEDNTWQDGAEYLNVDDANAYYGDGDLDLVPEYQETDFAQQPYDDGLEYDDSGDMANPVSDYDSTQPDSSDGMYQDSSFYDDQDWSADDQSMAFGSGDGQAMLDDDFVPEDASTEVPADESNAFDGSL